MTDTCCKNVARGDILCPCRWPTKPRIWCSHCLSVAGIVPWPKAVMIR